MKNTLIIGGAGFIGSNVAKRMVDDGFSVTIIDGMLPHTGASRNNIADLLDQVTFIEAQMEEVLQLGDLLEAADVVIAAFGWTSHKSAFDRPLYDLELNLRAHIHLLEQVKAVANKPFIINLGSSVQFGKVSSTGQIEVDAEQYPLDVQGIHKIAAESYYRIFAGMYDIDVYSLRIPNCFGTAQKTSGEDIGLIGSFIREALAGNDIAVFGSGRKRSVLYVDDLSIIMSRLAAKPPKGFVALNMPAYNLEIGELAQLIIDAAGNGRLLQQEMPAMIGKMDVAGATFNWSDLQNILSDITLMPVKDSLRQTVQYFKSRINE